MIRTELEKLISDKSATIGVVGLGYVGLPLIVEFTLKGFRGIGFEVDEKKTADINAGRSYIVDVPDENVAKCVTAGTLAATTDFSKLGECDVIVVCVPTPLRKTKDPDMSYILAAGGEIQNYLRRGQ
jgi:UDP-N-acetyl-D-glucosamine dehydrogenase